MIYIQFEKETEARAFVSFIHYSPFDPTEGLGKTQEELLLNGKLIESIPSPERREGKEARPYFNLQTMEFWYEYVNIPIPIDDRLTQVEKISAENKKANLDTQEAVLQLYELVAAPATK